MNQIDERRFQEEDIIGRVYEYFLQIYAASGMKDDGEFYTPACVVKLIAEMIELYSGVVYDKRQAYLIQANGKEKSPKSLDIKGFGDCLVLGDFLLNGHFRRKRPITARQILTTGANEKAIV